MLPAYVKPFVRRQKNDAADAAAIVEAVTRPDMRFGPVRSTDDQSALMLHRARELLVGQRTKVMNALRSHLAELGIVAPRGAWRMGELVAIIEGETDPRLPPVARRALRALARQLDTLSAEIADLEQAIKAQHKESPVAQALVTIPGIGPITASAIAATVGDGSQFTSARHFAAWLGLVPKQHSTGGKARLGAITKMGDRYLRTLLVVGATAVLRPGTKATSPLHLWARRLAETKPKRLVSVALANKLARVAYAVMATVEVFRRDPAAA
ncbi:hypothetical protein GCM10007148_11890 [Parvularcula lutaonensis]|nr:hypothetical protein GCM10007148_11890 [Parvularcula lutaonensis]